MSMRHGYGRVRVPLVCVALTFAFAIANAGCGGSGERSPSAAEVESPPFEPSAEADVERRRPRPPRRRRRRVEPVEPVEPSVGVSPGSFWSIVAAGSDVSAFALFVVLAVRRRRGDVAAFGVPASPSLWVSVSDPSSGDAVAVVERLRPPRPRPPRRPRRERDRGFVAASPSLVGSTIVSLFARSTSPVCASRSISASAGSVLDDARVEAPFAEPPLDPPRPPRPRPPRRRRRAPVRAGVPVVVPSPLGEGSGSGVEIDSTAAGAVSSVMRSPSDGAGEARRDRRAEAPGRPDSHGGGS